MSPWTGIDLWAPDAQSVVIQVDTSSIAPVWSIGRKPMPTSDDEIFNQWMNKAAEFGGVLPASIASRLMAGARFVNKFLPTEAYAETLALKIAPEEALKLGFSVLSKLGKLESNDDIKPPHPILKAVVGAGFLDMNPAIVRLEALDGDSGECELRISATAKEGLVKQDTASTAVKRVVSELREITART